MPAAHVRSFFDPVTFTVSHVVSDPSTKACAIVDPVLDFDAAAGRTSTDSVDQLIAYVREQGLSPQWVLETHVHADHLSAGHLLRKTLGVKIGIGDGIASVQKTFAKLFNLTDLATDGRQFDSCLEMKTRSLLDRYAGGSFIRRAIRRPASPM